MKKFTFKNNLLKLMLLMITVFTTGNLFAQSVTFTAPVAVSPTVIAGGSLSFTGQRSGTFAGSGDYTWTWSATGGPGVSFSGTNPQTNGNTTSTKTVTFNNAGNYTIKLTVTRSTSSVEVTKIVQVLSAPPAAGAPNLLVDCGAPGAVLPPSSCQPTDFSARFFEGDFVEGSAANGTSLGAVWRFANVNQSGDPLTQINATVTVEAIYQAVLAELDDDNAQNEVPATTTETEGWFAPRIDPDQSLDANESRHGFIQFKIEFWKENPSNTNDYVDAASLLGVNYAHRDIDGSNGDGDYYFRETGAVKQNGTLNILANANTELTSYDYIADGAQWKGFAGSICTRNQTSRFANSAAAFIYGTAQSSITVRMGYDYQDQPQSGSYGDVAARLYASEFRCFSFPEVTQFGLPVKLTYFNAKREGNDVKLTWETATEDNNLGFEIERRVGSGAWQKLGFAATKANGGNSTSLLNYAFTDVNHTAKGVTQYRLRQVDIDRHFSYSDIRTIRSIGLSAKTLVYPNPSSDGKVNIVFEDNKSALDVSLSDMNGRIIKQWRKVTSSAIQVNDLTPGMYSLRIVDNESGEQTVEKIVVNKR